MTLVELLLVMTIMLIITPAIISLFTTVTKGFARDEAYTSITKTNRELMSYLNLKIGSSKRIFTNDAADGITLLGRLDMSGNCPASLTGSKLPGIVANGSFDVSTTLCQPASFGNMFLFLAQGPQATYRGVSNIYGSTVTLSVDTYNLYYFYLTAQNPHNTTGFNSYRLVEWRSVPLADAQAIKNVFSSDVSLGSNLIKQMQAPTPRPTYQVPVSYAVDFGMPVTQAFGKLAEMGQAATMSVGSPSYTTLIPRDYPTTVLIASTPTTLQVDPRLSLRYWTYMNQMGMGRIFRYGVAPNNAARQIPRYGIASGLFPGGFEVGVIGSPAARQVLMRVNHVVQVFGATSYNDQMMVGYARDVY